MKLNKALKCKRKFLRIFPHGFRDELYDEWERGYKWEAHQQWNKFLNRTLFKKLLQEKKYQEIATQALRIESKTNLLFSFEKIAIRDAVKSLVGAKAFAEGLYDFLHGKGSLKAKLERWEKVVSDLPRIQTRVMTWPILTVFSFIAQPDKHIYLKPTVTKVAAEKYGFDFEYHPPTSFDTYLSLLEFVDVIKADIKDLKPRDMIDIQSFIWVLGSPQFG